VIIADTGFWVALFDQKDTFHALAYQRLGELNEPLLSTLPVVTEVCHLLQRRVGNEKVLAFIRSHQRGVFQLFNLGETHFPQIAELMRQ
jgi:predicted nucleic acid-binding protein